MTKRFLALITLFLAALWLSSPQRAFSSQLLAPASPLGSGFTYQGFLKDAFGSPVNSTCDLRFSLWDDPSAGSQIGADSTSNGVSVTNGNFSTLVNAGGQFGSTSINNVDARWLEVEVMCTGDAGFTALTPRQPLTRTLQTHDHWGQTWNGAGTGLTLSGGSTGLTAGGSNYGVYGLTSTTSGTTYGVYGQSASSSGFGVYGYTTASTGVNYGVFGRSISSSGFGVYGSATASTGYTTGVYGQSASTSGQGVTGIATTTTGTNYGMYGLSNSSAGIGVYGYDTATNGSTMGVLGRTDSTSGYGVFGYAYATTGSNFGVYGSTRSPTGTGVYGDNLAIGASGSAYGVYGQSAGFYGIGVYGNTTYPNGITIGVYGHSPSHLGVGVYGRNTATTGSGSGPGVFGLSAAPNGIGVYGAANQTTGPNFGIYGSTASPNGYAGYFAQKVYVGGLLTKAGGGFKIDHPLDPANQYLFHSFVESPEMTNVYNGTATLDNNGQAWVQLPAWFEALNQDFHYQLTPLGGSMPDLYVAQGVQNNNFQIAGGTPGMQVSWLLTGVRHDPWALANHQEVEQPKPPEQQNKYLHPELYGMPIEMMVNYTAPPEAIPTTPASSPLVPVLAEPETPVLPN